MPRFKLLNPKQFSFVELRLAVASKIFPERALIIADYRIDIQELISADG